MRPTMQRLAVSVSLAALLAGTGLTAPAQANIPTGAITRVSPLGGASDPAIDDAGAAVAYLIQPAGHVMVDANRVVDAAQAREVAISGDGRVVAFSTNTGLVPGDANGASDVYALARDGGGLRLVSSGASGVGAYSPSVDGDGSTIAFSAGGTGSGARREVFVRDDLVGVTKVDPSGGVNCDCIRPSIDNSGTSVAFEVTDAGIFVWNRVTGVSQLPGSGKGAGRPQMSGGGAAVAYQRGERVVVFNRVNGVTSVVTEPGSNPSISADGRVVAYQASNAFGDDGNGKPDVVVHDFGSGQTKVVSANPLGKTVSGGSYQPSINSNGGRVAFESEAAELVVGDTNGLTDVYLRIPADGAVAPPCCVGGGGGPGGGGVPGVPGVPGIPGSAGSVDDTPDIPGAYWLVATDGGIFSYGGLGVAPRFFGSTGAVALNKPIVGMAATPSGNGYWFVASDGGIFTFGDAKFHGSTGAVKLNRPVVGMAATPSGNGYWLVADDGGIFTFGDARFHGSTGAVKLNKPIVGMAATPSGNGYWLVASDGGVFTFGDAGFMGSTGDVKLNRPIIGMMSRPQADGYWMIADDGGVFSFGAAPFKGSTGAARLPAPIVGIARTHTGNGYWFTGADGSLYAFGDAGHFGHLLGTRLNKPVVGMAASGR